MEGNKEMKPVFFKRHPIWKVLLIVACAIAGLAVLFIIVALLLFSPRPLSKEERAKVKADRPIAETSIRAYIDGKYDLDYKNLSISPVTSASTSEWVYHYYDNWEASFKVDNHKYHLKINADGTNGRDDYQYDEILAAYQKVAEQYFQEIIQKYDVSVKAMVLEYGIIYGERDRIRLVGTYYDGTNIDEVLRETGIGFTILGDDVAVNNALWDDARNVMVSIYADFNGVKILICDEEDLRLYPIHQPSGEDQIVFATNDESEPYKNYPIEYDDMEEEP